MRPYYRFALFGLGITVMAAAWFWPWQRRVEQTPAIIQPSAPVEVEYILVASRQLEAGSPLTADKAEWVPVAGKPIPAGATVRRETTDAANPFVGRFIVQSAAKGDALLPINFASADGASYLAQQIETGKRAYAISIDTKGTATAGNFILPNDRVDVIRSFNSSFGLQSETILTNIRVLAVGQTVHGEGLSSSGDTATVEVDLGQAELLATAQRTGQISLALRNPADTATSSPHLSGIAIIRPSTGGEKVQ